jgi:hypothetical protein
MDKIAVFEKQVLRIKFGPKKEKAEGQIKLHNEELYNIG